MLLYNNLRKKLPHIFQGRIQDFSYVGQDFLTNAIWGGGEKKVLKIMLAIKYRLAREADFRFTHKSCSVTAIFSHHISDSDYQ